MGLLDRIAFITRSKANALMDSLEDPREAINQTIADASVEYAKVKAAAAKVIAGETSAKNTLEEYEKKHAQYEKAAENAVLAGDDASAEIALEKAAEYEALIADWTERVKTAVADADAMRRKLNDMARDNEIKADFANAEAAKSVSKVQKVSSENAFSRFDKLAERAANERAEAEALSSLEKPLPDSGEDVLKKYGTASSSASERLAELKARLGK